MAEVRIIQFSLNVAKCLSSLPAKFNDKIRRGSLDQGLQLAWDGFSIDFMTQYLGNGKEVICGLSIATKVDDLELLCCPFCVL